MDELGFSEEDKNWAELMYSTISDQYIPPGSNMADNELPVSEETGEVIEPKDDDGTPMGASGETVVTYYSQIDSRWKDIKYGKSGTIGAAGCGPTSLAIVVSTLKGKNVTPVEVANWSVKNGHRCEGSGSYHSLIPEGAKYYGLKVEKLGRSSRKEITEHLSSGKLVIAIMAKGHFTYGGHFIVLRGITPDGKVLVADPASRKRSNMKWDMSIILNEARGTAAAGGPFWSLSL
ncbi:MAG: C39 family peptidase [Eubacteriales bacterium]|nr:C39 family peptidase [Eubacteriales bacterium]